MVTRRSAAAFLVLIGAFSATLYVLPAGIAVAADLKCSTARAYDTECDVPQKDKNGKPTGLLGGLNCECRETDEASKKTVTGICTAEVKCEATKTAEKEDPQTCIEAGTCKGVKPGTTVPETTTQPPQPNTGTPPVPMPNVPTSPTSPTSPVPTTPQPDSTGSTPNWFEGPVHNNMDYLQNINDDGPPVEPLKSFTNQISEANNNFLDILFGGNGDGASIGEQGQTGYDSNDESLYKQVYDQVFGPTAEMTGFSQGGGLSREEIISPEDFVPGQQYGDPTIDSANSPVPEHPEAQREDCSYWVSCLAMDALYTLYDLKENVLGPTDGSREMIQEGFAEASRRLKAFDVVQDLDQYGADLGFAPPSEVAPPYNQVTVVPPPGQTGWRNLPSAEYTFRPAIPGTEDFVPGADTSILYQNDQPNLTPEQVQYAEQQGLSDRLAQADAETVRANVADDDFDPEVAALDGQTDPDANNARITADANVLEDDVQVAPLDGQTDPDANNQKPEDGEKVAAAEQKEQCSGFFNCASKWGADTLVCMGNPSGCLFNTTADAKPKTGSASTQTTVRAFQAAADAFGTQRGYTPEQKDMIAKASAAVVTQESNMNSNAQNGKYVGPGQLSESETIRATNELRNLAQSPDLSAEQRSQVQSVVDRIDAQRSAGLNPNRDAETGAWLFAARQANMSDVGRNVSPMDFAANNASTPREAAAIMASAQLAPSVYGRGEFNPNAPLTSSQARAFSNNGINVSTGQTVGDALNSIENRYARNFDRGINTYANNVSAPNPSFAGVSVPAPSTGSFDGPSVPSNVWTGGTTPIAYTGSDNPYPGVWDTFSYTSSDIGLRASSEASVVTGSNGGIDYSILPSLPDTSFGYLENLNQNEAGAEVQDQSAPLLTRGLGRAAESVTDWDAIQNVAGEWSGRELDFSNESRGIATAESNRIDTEAEAVDTRGGDSSVISANLDREDQELGEAMRRNEIFANQDRTDQELGEAMRQAERLAALDLSDQELGQAMRQNEIFANIDSSDQELGEAMRETERLATLDREDQALGEQMREAELLRDKAAADEKVANEKMLEELRNRLENDPRMQFRRNLLEAAEWARIADAENATKLTRVEPVTDWDAIQNVAGEWSGRELDFSDESRGIATAESNRIDTDAESLNAGGEAVVTQETFDAIAAFGAQPSAEDLAGQETADAIIKYDERDADAYAAQAEIDAKEEEKRIADDAAIAEARQRAEKALETSCASEACIGGRLGDNRARSAEELSAFKKDLAEKEAERTAALKELDALKKVSGTEALIKKVEQGLNAMNSTKRPTEEEKATMKEGRAALAALRQQANAVGDDSALAKIAGMERRLDSISSKANQFQAMADSSKLGEAGAYFTPEGKKLVTEIQAGVNTAKSVGPGIMSAVRASDFAGQVAETRTELTARVNTLNNEVATGYSNLTAYASRIERGVPATNDNWTGYSGAYDDGSDPIELPIASSHWAAGNSGVFAEFGEVPRGVDTGPIVAQNVFDDDDAFQATAFRDNPLESKKPDSVVVSEDPSTVKEDNVRVAVSENRGPVTRGLRAGEGESGQDPPSIGRRNRDWLRASMDFNNGNWTDEEWVSQVESPASGNEFASEPRDAVPVGEVIRGDDLPDVAQQNMDRINIIASECIACLDKYDLEIAIADREGNAPSFTGRTPSEEYLRWNGELNQMRDRYNELYTADVERVREKYEQYGADALTREDISTLVRDMDVNRPESGMTRGSEALYPRWDEDMQQLSTRLAQLNEGTGAPGVITAPSADEGAPAETAEAREQRALDAIARSDELSWDALIVAGDGSGSVPPTGGGVLAGGIAPPGGAVPSGGPVSTGGDAPAVVPVEPTGTAVPSVVPVAPTAGVVPTVAGPEPVVPIYEGAKEYPSNDQLRPDVERVAADIRRETTAKPTVQPGDDRAAPKIERETTSPAPPVSVPPRPTVQTPPFSPPTNPWNPNGPVGPQVQPGQVYGQDTYCLVNIDPIIVLPVSAGTPFPSNCYNGAKGGRGGMSNGLGSMASGFGQLLGRTFGQNAQQPQPNAPVVTPRVTIVANPQSVSVGSTTRLSWTSTHTTVCSLVTATSTAFSSLPPNGTITTAPIATTTVFRMNCTGSNGSGVAETRVTAR